MQGKREREDDDDNRKRQKIDNLDKTLEAIRKKKEAIAKLNEKTSDPSEVLRKKEEAIALKMQREAKKQQDQIRKAALNEVHDEEVKAKGGLKVAYHPLLRTVAEGRIDRNIVSLPKANLSTVKANQKLPTPSTPGILKPQEINLDEQAPDQSKNPYYDSSIASNTFKPRTKKTFKFAEPGKYINLANQLRTEAKLEKLKQEIEESAKKAGMERELELVSNKALRNKEPPTIEWWDAKLVNESYDGFDIGHGSLKEIINNLVQHPVPIEPPAEPGAPPAKPIMLTKKEQKRLRRQNRMEIQKDRQYKIKLGLLPAEQPKITKENFMRVLGQEAILEPSKVEAEMARQVEERKQKHKELIESSRLTEEERKAKKDRKLQEDTSQIVKVAVFKINSLQHKLHLSKVNLNAKQFKLNGLCIINPGLSMVIVEGGPKGIKQYKHLMLDRIKWNEAPPQEDGLPNECKLIWEGEISLHNFRFFRTKTFKADYEVREFLEGMGVGHYWNAAKTHVDDAF